MDQLGVRLILIITSWTASVSTKNLKRFPTTKTWVGMFKHIGPRRDRRKRKELKNTYE